TSVYHKPAAEPYVVPFISDHPRHIFINIIQTRLANALKCSSTFEIFNYERRHIKLMLLYNGYPSSFIETQYRKFFNEYIYSTSFLPFIIDEEQFFLMRNKLFSQFIYESSHVSEDNALINTVNIRTAQVPQNTTTEINVEHNTTTITTPKRNNTLFLHYTYEQRFKPMKRGLHHIHKDIFSQSQTQNVKMIVGNRNRRNATHELIRKRPPRFILKNQKRPKRINSTINKQTTTTTTLTTPAY
ncbi:unnamed protein product, partial [Adineta steineri]